MYDVMSRCSLDFHEHTFYTPCIDLFRGIASKQMMHAAAYHPVELKLISSLSGCVHRRTQTLSAMLFWVTLPLATPLSATPLSAMPLLVMVLWAKVMLATSLTYRCLHPHCPSIVWQMSWERPIDR